MGGKSKIVQIGNSMGVRIPRPLLEASGLSGDVKLSVSEGRIVIEAARHPRAGWAESMKAMAAAGDDAAIWQEFGNDFDEEEWAW